MALNVRVGSRWVSSALRVFPSGLPIPGDGSPNHRSQPSAVSSAATLSLVPYRSSAAVRGTGPRNSSYVRWAAR